MIALLLIAVSLVTASFSRTFTTERGEAIPCQSNDPIDGLLGVLLSDGDDNGGGGEGEACTDCPPLESRAW